MTKHIERGAYFKIKKPRWNWDRIGGLGEVKEKLEEMVTLPLKHPESFRKGNLSTPRGVLLWGPPGGGKTVLAEAAAYHAGCSYIMVKAIEIMSEPDEITVMYETAAELAPCVIFINEVDALAPRRDVESKWVEGITRDAPVRIAPESITDILYKALDDVGKNVITIGGTYRPDVLDKQILTKGRLDRKLYVPAPDFDDRLEIFQKQLKKTPIASDVSLEEFAKRTEYYVGADIRGVVREATAIAIREKGHDFDLVERKHFEQAMKRIPPYLSPEAAEKYEETYKEECEHCSLF
ncbi:AAA family ATPase [archaeon]|nr:AAA family ATPase [archaeon]